MGQKGSEGARIRNTLRYRYRGRYAKVRAFRFHRKRRGKGVRVSKALLSSTVDCYKGEERRISLTSAASMDTRRGEKGGILRRRRKLRRIKLSAYDVASRVIFL